ncbi:MAG: hypothetical protein R3C14_30380 [Caldilineaceae bacterium]
MTTDRPTAYRIFLLTFWLDEAGDPTDPETWLFRLEEPKRGQRQGCVGVTALVARLISELRDDAAASESPD